MDTWEERKLVALIANRLLREGYAAWPEAVAVAQQVRSLLTGDTKCPLK